MNPITSLNSTDAFRSDVRYLTIDSVRFGNLVQSECACGNPVTKAHHDNYRFPFIIKWMCGKCHSRRHKELGWGFKGMSQYFDADHCAMVPADRRRARAIARGPASQFDINTEIKSTFDTAERKDLKTYVSDTLRLHPSSDRKLSISIA